MTVVTATPTHHPGLYMRWAKSVLTLYVRFVPESRIMTRKQNPLPTHGATPPSTEGGLGGSRAG